MKNLELLFIAFCVIMFSCNSPQDLSAPETDKEKLSYSFGMEYAFALQQQGMDSIIDIDFFQKALRDVFLANPEDSVNSSLDISKEEGEQILNDYFDMVQKSMMDQQVAENKKAIEASEGGEITLASGLIIIINENLEGPSPSFSDTVVTEISIKKEDGELLQKFDDPQIFVVSDVFPGLSEGLQLMSAGDQWDLVIPPSLGMGGNETLVFEVRLVSINGQ